MCRHEYSVTTENLALTCFQLKGPVKLIERVKIPHSFLQSVSDQFHIIVCLCNSSNGCQRIFRNPLLKIEIWVILIFGVIFDQP